MAADSTPPTPQKKRARITLGDFVAMTIFLVGMACAAAGTSYFAFTNFTSMKDDLWLNSHGTLAQNPSLDVRYRIHDLPELCAYYDTQREKPYSKCITLWLPLVFIDENSPQIIHYDPASPQHFSSSWGRQILFSRTCFFLLFLAVAICLDGFVFVLIFGAIGRIIVGPGPEPDVPSGPPL